MQVNERLESAVNRLWPRPKRVQAHSGAWTLPSELAVVAPTLATEGARLLWTGVEERTSRRLSIRLRPAESGGLTCALLARRARSDESYRLTVGVDGVRIEASSVRGLSHGASTFFAWVDLAGEADGGMGRRIPCIEIEDEPSLAHRGVMLDVSRDRVPTRETLFELVDRFADLKYNQLQLYFEHPFAYRGHEAVWRDSSPFTPDEIEALDRHCASRGIELVPNQNSLGHFHRWLRHEEYRRLAECPDGFETAFTAKHEPYSLCPTDPGSIELLRDLYDQLLPHFRSRLFNVGLDETFDLGLGRSREAAEAKGRSGVYLDYLRAIHREVGSRGFRMMFWGDVILNHPESIPGLPQDAIALEWGYEADHPFAEDGRRFHEAGLEYYVCPGTSSWNSVGGRTTNALANLANAARAGADTGASGYLVTDWGDHGHWQPLPVSYLGFAMGAGTSWNPDSAGDLAIEAWGERLEQLFPDVRGFGESLVQLGRAGEASGATNKNGSPLFRFLLFAERVFPHPEIEGLTASGLGHALEHLESVMADARAVRADASAAARTQGELVWAAELLHLAARLGRARLRAGEGRMLSSIPRVERAGFLGELVDLESRHRALWLARSRPGGLEDSSARFRRLRELLDA